VPRIARVRAGDREFMDPFLRDCRNPRKEGKDAQSAEQNAHSLRIRTLASVALSATHGPLGRRENCTTATLPMSFRRTEIVCWSGGSAIPFCGRVETS